MLIVARRCRWGEVKQGSTHYVHSTHHFFDAVELASGLRDAGMSCCWSQHGQKVNKKLEPYLEVNG